MAIQFEKTQRQEEEILKISDRVMEIKKTLTPYMDVMDQEKMDHLLSDIHTKAEKFKKKDRKLTLAVVGRVKAGKSSFLNELVFNGKDILPHAFRPKTATLTKIEYDENPHLEINYYTKDEWVDLRKLAQNKEAVREDVRTAKELMDDTSRSGIDVNFYLEKGTETIPLSDDSAVESVLNDYVGANGKVTPIVKSVTLCIKKPELEGMSIVDTPGTNDPVVSRTLTTKKFLAECDVVFFLTSADQALDANDIDLLQAQLPGQGVGEIILIDSKFDNAVLDAYLDGDGLEQTVEEEKKKFTRKAEKMFTGYAEEEEKRGKPEKARLMRSCTKPFFLSSIMHRMASKTPDAYTEQEKQVYENLNEDGDMSTEIVAELGDMTPIETAFKNIILHKDEKLADMVRNTVPALKGRLNDELDGMAARAREQRLILENHDQKEIKSQQKAMENQILQIKGDVADQFGQVITDAEIAKVKAASELHALSANRPALTEKTGTEQHEVAYTVDDSHWYNPFSWGNSHTEYHTCTTSYKYIEASDALENLQKYAHEAQGTTENRISEAIDLKNLKNKLLRTIVNHIDAGSTDFNPNQMKLIVQNTLNQIELPEFHISLDEYMNSISSKFSGEVRDAKDRTNLQLTLTHAVEELAEDLNGQVAKSIKQFKAQMIQLQGHFVDALLKGINEEFEEITRQAEDKESSIERLKTYETRLKSYKIA